MALDTTPVLKLAANDPLNTVGLDLYRRLIEFTASIENESIVVIYEEYYLSSTGVRLETHRKSYIIKDRNEVQHRWTDWITALGTPIMQGTNYALLNLIPLEASSEYPI